MSNILLLNQPQPNIGLQTQTYTVPSTNVYSVMVQVTEVPPTGLSILVKNNGSTVFTAPTITPTQIAQQFKYSKLFTAADVVTVVFGSSDAIDAQLNNVKATTTIMQGY